MSNETRVDWLVVGSGASGCVVANTLSGDENKNVLLLEAGPNPNELTPYPANLASPHAAVLEGYNWPFRATPQSVSLGNVIKRTGTVAKGASLQNKIAGVKVAISHRESMAGFTYPVGRVLGGSTAINGCLADIPDASDFYHWDIAGQQEWSGNALQLSKYKLIEKMGSAIKTIQISELSNAQLKFMEGARSAGWVDNAQRSRANAGINLLQRTVAEGMRLTAADVFLKPVSHRKNLEVRCDTTVYRVLFDENRKRAIGVEVLVNGATEEIYAENVVLCGGAINTPSLLMRSGIGEAAELEAVGIRCNVSVPAVGKNLMDHPSVGLWGVPKENVCIAGEDTHQIVLRLKDKSTSGHGSPHIFMASSVETSVIPELQKALNSPLGVSLTVVLGQPVSRGSVSLVKKQSSLEPAISLNVATDPADVDEMIFGIRKAWEIAKTPELSSVFSRFFMWNDRLIDNTAMLRSSIGSFVRGSWHVCGTARLGEESDNNAVVNTQGKVMGCEGLFVADASVMRNISDGPTSVASMLVGFHLASIWNGCVFRRL